MRFSRSGLSALSPTPKLEGLWNHSLSGLYPSTCSPWVTLLGVLGLCIYINNAWCTDSAITERHCSPNVELIMVKCRPYYLPREFTSVIVTAVYTPPDANAKLAMEELHAAISKQQTTHPEAAFIVAGDFNHSNLKTVLPKFHQHVSCHTRGDKTLDHVYSNIPGAYRVTPLPHIEQSDHLFLFLSPSTHHSSNV